MKKVYIVLLTILACLMFASCNSKQDSFDSWYLNDMKLDDIWQCAKGQTQIIAFIDTGISDELADTLSERIIFKYNIFEKNDNVTDLHGHGSEIISVACNEALYGVYGIAPQSKIIVIKAVSDDGKTTNDNLYSALKIAQNKGASIVNISLGGYKSDDRVISQIQNMIDSNITVVAAAGDNQNKDLLFPANQDGVISVEAFDSKHKLWTNSNRSSTSIVRMPGVDIDVLGLDIYGNLFKEKADGTSQAAAITSAYIALLRDYYENQGIPYDNDRIIEALQTLNTKSENATIDFSKPFK